jgi:DNA repair exonuclease SbcCD ATPase subunit
MKFNTCVFMLVGIIGITPVCYAKTPAGTTSIDEVKQDAQSLMQTLKTYTADRRDEASNKAKAALDNLDARIETLETSIDNNWDKMNKVARNNARASLKALRSQRIELAEWYGRLKSSSNDAWGKMKIGFSDAYGAVNSAWGKAKKEFDPE